MEERVHQRAQAAQVEALGGLFFKQHVVEHIPLVGVLLLVLLVAEEWVRQMGAAVADDSEGEIFVPREDAPAAVAVDVAVDVEVLP